MGQISVAQKLGTPGYLFCNQHGGHDANLLAPFDKKQLENNFKVASDRLLFF